jgi:hypothetical protein
MVKRNAHADLGRENRQSKISISRFFHGFFPKKYSHKGLFYAMACGQVIVQVHGKSPFQFNFINPDDASQSK